MTWRLPLRQLALLAVLAACGGLGFLRLLPVAQVVAEVAVAAVVATAISGRRGGWAAPRSLGGRAGQSTLGFVVVAIGAVLRPTTWHLLPTASTLHALGDAIVNGLARLLSSAEPAPATPSTLVLPIVVTWLVAFVGVEVAVRNRAPLAPVVPAAVAFVAVLLLGGSGSTTGLLSTSLVAMLLASSALLAFVRAPEGTTSARVGVLVVVGGSLVIVALLVASVLPLGSRPFDLHDHVSSDVAPRPEVSPLARIQGRLLDKGDPTMFQVQVPSAEVDRAPNWRLAVLDRFDGTRWSTSVDGRAAGGDLPADPSGSSTLSSQPLHQRVTIAGLDASALPAAGRPTHTSLPLVYESAADGTLDLPEPLASGLSYDVDSRVPNVTPDQLRAASVDRSAPSYLTDLPDVDAAAVDAITSATAASSRGQADGSLGALQAIEAHLRGAPFAYSAKAPSGESYGQVADFLTRSHAGTAEQFAGAFCLMVRTQQVPCRVAAGFRRGTAQDGTFTVRSADAFAWPEVLFSRLGWVPFDPTPKAGSAVAPAVADLAGATADAPAPVVAPAQADTGGGTTSGSAPGGSSSSSTADVVLVVLIVLLVLVLVGPLLVVGLKGLRRRRRARAETPTARVLGAWQHAGEQVGRPRSAHVLTVAEVVSVAARHHGEPIRGPLAELGSLTNLALFDRRGPTDQDSAVAWARADEAARLADAGRTRRGRLWHRVDPRPLRPRREQQALR